MSSDLALESGLKIYLLGPPQVQWAGQSLAIPRRLVRALFYYLAAQDRPVARDQLCLLFWPDIADSEAHRNLTRLLVHLRQALPAPDWLVAEAGLIYLAPEKLECDVIQFKKLAGGQPETAEALQEALALYRAPLLSGFYLPDRLEFENWVSQERNALERLYLNALASLVEIYTARQDFSRAIEYGRRYLETDELAEGMHRRLISLYALAGDRARALRQFEECAATLERELGTSPLLETRALYQTVRDGKAPQLPLDRLEGAQPAGWTRLRLDVPLVGRAPTLQQLEEALLRARTGQSSVVLISGEPGIGKSRLLHDFAARCWSSNRVLFGSGQPGTQSVPYHPIVEALRTQTAAVPVSLSPLWQAEVARLLPELNGLVPDLPKPLLFKEEEARVRLFEGLCRFVFALQTQTSPLLFCLDDLHWFDSTSLSWLTYLCREFLGKSSRVMILGAYRLEEADKISAFRDSVDRFGLLEEIQVQGLDGAHIHELLEHTIGDVPGNTRLASRLQEATGGNPFFLIEILRALGEERPGEDLARVADFPLPESVREVINRRLARLDPSSRQILEAGAVLGSTFRFHDVCLTAGRNDLETAAGLDELAGRQLLVEEAEGYHFSHDLVRRATVEAASPLRMRLLHGRAGKALEKLYRTRPAALAAHFDQGGDWDKAFHYYLLSAGEAGMLFAWQESEAHLKRALELLSQIDPDCTQPDRLAQRGEVLEKLARLHALQGRPSERDADLKQLDELVRRCQNPRLRLRSIVLQSHYLHMDGRYADVVETAERGVALAEELKDNEARLRLLAQAGRAYAYLGQTGQALSLLEKARAVKDKSVTLRLRASVMTALAMVYIHLGDYQQALGYQKEAADYLQKLGDSLGAAQLQIEVSFLCTNLGRFEEARRTLTEVLAFFRKVGASPDEAHALLALGGACSFGGDYTAAVRCYSEALELQQRLRGPHLAAAAEAGLGLDYYHLGDLTQSRVWLERGLERARSIGHRMRVTQVLVELAMLELRAGNLPAARASLQEGLTIARETHNEDLLAAGLAVAAGLERETGAPARALELAKEATRLAQSLGQATGEMWGRTEAGLAHLSLGELDQAETELRQAESLVAHVHQGWIGTEQVHLAYARALECAGKPEQAREQRRLAQDAIQAKADRIQDPVQRGTFLELYRHVLKN